MENLDLTKLTTLELFDLGQKIRDEQKERPNRDKVKIWTVFIPFVFNYGYIKPENAIKAMEELLKDDWVASFKTDEDYLKISVTYTDESGLQFCEDYEETEK